MSKMNQREIFCNPWKKPCLYFPRHELSVNHTFAIKKFTFLTLDKKNRILVENWILVKNLISGSKPIFFVQHKKLCGQKLNIYNVSLQSKFCSNIEILLKYRNFGQKSKFCSKIEILSKNRNCTQKSKFWSKIEIVLKNPQKFT